MSMKNTTVWLTASEEINSTNPKTGK